jgi:hypothetical protein
LEVDLDLNNKDLDLNNKDSAAHMAECLDTADLLNTAEEWVWVWEDKEDKISMEW